MTDYWTDQWQEHCDYEANARYDNLSEAYGATARDCADMAAEDEIYYGRIERELACDAMEARGGPLPFFDDELPF